MRTEFMWITFVKMVMAMFFNESISVMFHGNEQILSACGNTISSWLFVHFYYTCFVSMFVLFLPVTLGVSIIDSLLMCYQCDQQRLEDFSLLERDYSRSAVICQYFLHETH